MPTPEQALEEMTRENERLGLYDDVPLPSHWVTLDILGVPAHFRSAIAKYAEQYANLYGQQCAKTARAKALEEAANVCTARFVGDLNREDMEARRCADAIRALAAAEEAK